MQHTCSLNWGFQKKGFSHNFWANGKKMIYWKFHDSLTGRKKINDNWNFIIHYLEISWFLNRTKTINDNGNFKNWLLDKAVKSQGRGGSTILNGPLLTGPVFTVAALLIDPLLTGGRKRGCRGFRPLQYFPPPGNEPAPLRWNSSQNKSQKTKKLSPPKLFYAPRDVLNIFHLRRDCPHICPKTL